MNNTNITLTDYWAPHNKQLNNLFYIYCPPPSKKNKFSDSMFFDQFSDFLEHSDSLPGKILLVGGFNFHFENVENNNSRKLHDIVDMFNLTQSVSEPTHNQGHLLNLVFSKQSDNILISTKLHHGLTSDHTAILCKRDVPVPVQSLKLFRTAASKRLAPAPLNKISLTLSHKSVLSMTTITISVLSLTSTPSLPLHSPYKEADATCFSTTPRHTRRRASVSTGSSPFHDLPCSLQPLPSPPPPHLPTPTQPRPPSPFVNVLLQCKRTRGYSRTTLCSYDSADSSVGIPVSC